jgi:crossover junction endodeoxyribonuclease RusA
MSINLPWPPKQLSPNSRIHWGEKSKIAKKYRHDCYLLCKAANLAAPETDGKLVLWMTFFPPDKRARDDDNLVASFKNGRDGIADALGIDDKRFICRPFVHTETGGYVRIAITTLPDITTTNNKDNHAQ